MHAFVQFTGVLESHKGWPRCTMSTKQQACVGIKPATLIQCANPPAFAINPWLMQDLAVASTAARGWTMHDYTHTDTYTHV